MTFKDLHDNTALWDYICKDTGLEKHRVITVVKAMLYGFIVKVCVTQKITIEEAVSVRSAFNNFVEGKV